MVNYFVRNLETDKLEVYFSKDLYKKLDIKDQKHIKSYFLFSRNKSAWISKAFYNNCSGHIGFLISLGFEDKGTQGQSLSFAEKIEIKKEKAEKRAIRFNFKAIKLNEESNRAYQNAKRISSYIPFGQPILVGHHSEKRHRSDISKIDNSMRKSVELDKKASYYSDKSDTAEMTASQSELTNQVYLNNRIKENQSHIRRCEKYGYKADKYKEKLEFYQDCLNKIGGFKYTKESLKDATHVKDCYGWYEIKRLNDKTVTCIERPRQNVIWDRKIEYAKIKDARFSIEQDNNIIDIEEVKKELSIVSTSKSSPEFYSSQLDIFGGEQKVICNYSQMSLF